MKERKCDFENETLNLILDETRNFWGIHKYNNTNHIQQINYFQMLNHITGFMLEKVKRKFKYKIGQK